MDSNTDGFVDFDEFVAATLHVRQLEEHDSEKWQVRSQAAFDKLDVDGDGFITPEELRMVKLKSTSVTHLWKPLTDYQRIDFLQHTGLKSSIEPLLEEADTDKDGKIDLSEFRRLLRNVSSRNVQPLQGLRNSRKM